jgi:hypothetical protein
MLKLTSILTNICQNKTCSRVIDKKNKDGKV